MLKFASHIGDPMSPMVCAVITAEGEADRVTSLLLPYSRLCSAVNAGGLHTLRGKEAAHGRTESVGTDKLYSLSPS